MFVHQLGRVWEGGANKGQWSRKQDVWEKTESTAWARENDIGWGGGCDAQSSTHIKTLQKVWDFFFFHIYAGERNELQQEEFKATDALK